MVAVVATAVATLRVQAVAVCEFILTPRLPLIGWTTLIITKKIRLSIETIFNLVGLGDNLNMTSKDSHL